MALRNSLLSGFLLFLFTICSSTYTFAQRSCGFDHVRQQLVSTNPEYQKVFSDTKAGITNNHTTAQRPTAASPVPVIFHIVLTAQQLQMMGGEAGVRVRADSQIAVLNRDFNAANPDSVLIPDVFKPLYGNVNIKFGLAHTAPDNTPTPGYEIVIINAVGTELDGGYGSGFGFSHAKYRTVGGANAWDPDSYLNIWVINPLENGNASNILGMAIPPYFISNTLPKEELGLMVHYGAFGKRVNLTDRYLIGADQGRTLTHEVGHYFELFHIWGDDDGKCPWTGGSDDGISDTPPQGYPSDGCNTFPFYDNCAQKTNSNGIMFMNYMDYSRDNCMALFTREQAARMYRTVQQGGASYQLTQRGALLSYPDSTPTPEANTYSIYPNPATTYINIVFAKKSSNLKGIAVYNLMGQLVDRKEITEQASYYSFDLSNVQTGIYLVMLDFESGKEVRKVIVR